MHNKTVLRIAFGLALLSGATISAPAQPTNGGTISGLVVDPSGALVPHAEIILSNGTGFSKAMMSDGVGAFQAEHLIPGEYSVSITAAGLTPALDGDVSVSNGEITRESIKLGISVNQQIEVNASDDTSLKGR